MHNKVPLVSVAGDLWAVAFRANFDVFWAHCMANKLRASRLDAAQHSAIHGLNTCTKLTQALSEPQQLAAQRAALQHVSAGLLTIEEVSSLLRIEGVKGTSSNGGTRGAQDTLNAFAAGGAEAAARLLVFARAAWVSEELIIVDLGARTKQMQMRALYQRLGRTDYDVEYACMEALPVHATHLHACVECRRVANAYSVDGGKSMHTFNELGMSSSMLCIECTGSDEGATHIRCAKRSSAALRTALAYEELMTTESEKLEDGSGDVVAVGNLLVGSGGSSSSGPASTSIDMSGIAARVRRDAKNALEQRAMALACGEQPMLCVPIVGRAIRLWNEWYALCSLCGAMVSVTPQSRYGAEICCNKCDAQMLGLPAPAPVEQQAAVCRYCTTKDTLRSSSRWKVLKAPLDVAGENANLPHLLRTVVYCPAHWRSWLAGAHRVLPTRVILSHIAHNAKPIFPSDKRRTANELGFDALTTGRKKRRTKGAKVDASELG